MEAGEGTWLSVEPKEHFIFNHSIAPLRLSRWLNPGIDLRKGSKPSPFRSMFATLTTQRIWLASSEVRKLPTFHIGTTTSSKEHSSKPPRDKGSGLSRHSVRVAIEQKQASRAIADLINFRTDGILAKSIATFIHRPMVRDAFRRLSNMKFFPRAMRASKR